MKSNIGHLKSAAGIAGLIKAVLALDNKVLPPTAGFVEVNPKLELQGSPFYIIDEKRPWQGKDHPGRANVIVPFGFGGADYHLALQEYREEDHRRRLSAGATVTPNVAVHSSPASAAPAWESRAGETEVIFFSAPDEDGLELAVRQFVENALHRDFAARVRPAELSCRSGCLYPACRPGSKRSGADRCVSTTIGATRTTPRLR